VQTAGDLVGLMVELTAGMQHGHDHLKRRFFLSRMHVDRYTAAVVLNGTGTVFVDGYLDGVAETRQRLIDGVVHHLVDKVMKSAVAGVADVHGGTFADSLKALQDSNRLGIIRSDLIQHFYRINITYGIFHILILLFIRHYTALNQIYIFNHRLAQTRV